MSTETSLSRYARIPSPRAIFRGSGSMGECSPTLHFDAVLNIPFTRHFPRNSRGEKRAYPVLVLNPLLAEALIRPVAIARVLRKLKYA